MNEPKDILQPADFCRHLLETLDASEGRRRRRKRDTTADAIGLQVKRDILQRTIEEAPSPEAFEGWLTHLALTAPASGPVFALASQILEEYRLYCHDVEFHRWLLEGAPSDDKLEKARD